MSRLLGVAGVLVAISILLWPVHERVLGTDIACGSTWSATSATGTNTFDAAIASDCRSDADSRATVAAVIGVGSILAAVCIGARRPLDSAASTPRPASKALLITAAVVGSLGLLAIWH